MMLKGSYFVNLKAIYWFKKKDFPYELKTYVKKRHTYMFYLHLIQYS